MSGHMQQRGKSQRTRVGQRRRTRVEKDGGRRQGTTGHDASTRRGCPPEVGGPDRRSAAAGGVDRWLGPEAMFLPW
ncbi:hypothetical protein KIN20_019199 [Parelaphostrongylus tenuis]|uniref:Uncharacterized protein n=1 Tax=Parelaphostrongylus tenuis TaxID=148309 RepID=A0AAD5MR83_PARTN|nr:hypothetical protein KIN20_019199 [Parelaphostrongylus tenuis]